MALGRLFENMMRLFLYLMMTFTLTASMLPAQRATPHATIRMAVMTGGLRIDDPAYTWLSHGVTFDLEKRLGQCANCEMADRLALEEVLHASVGQAEAARVAAVIARVKAAVVLSVNIELKAGQLALILRLWYPGQPTPAASFTAEGRLVDLFAIDEQLARRAADGLRSGGLDPGQPRHPQGLALRPAKTVAAYASLIQGMVALQQGQIDTARPLLHATLAAEPDNWWAHYFLGAVELYAGQILHAVDYGRKAVALDPDIYPGVYANLAYCYDAMARPQEARWARVEYERRTGHPLPGGGVPGSPGT